jgi:hypothetical protein
LFPRARLTELSRRVAGNMLCNATARKGVDGKMRVSNEAVVEPNSKVGAKGAMVAAEEWRPRLLGALLNAVSSAPAIGFMDAITDANNLIFKQRYRNASWIVVGTTTAGRLEKLDEFRLFPAADPVGTIVYGPHLFGTISGRWTVYKDPWLDVTGPGGGGVGGGEVMLLGYKGTTPLDTGCIYAPFATLQG